MIPPKLPRPPACDTAAANFPPQCMVMGADITGWDIPSISVNLVCSIFSPGQWWLAGLSLVESIFLSVARFGMASTIISLFQDVKSVAMGSVSSISCSGLGLCEDASIPSKNLELFHIFGLGT